MGASTSNPPKSERVSFAFILAVLGGTVAGAFVSGLSGFAFGMVALTVWAWALDPRLISPLIVFGSLVGYPSAEGRGRRRAASTRFSAGPVTCR